MTTSRSAGLQGAGQIARRIFLWAMIGSFCLAAAAGILVLLGVTFNDTGLHVLLTTLTVGLYSLAMLCCGAVFTRPERAVGILGSAVSILSLSWSVVMIWSEWSWDWEPFQILFSGITLTVAFSFASLVLASTAHRDSLIRGLLCAALGLLSLAALFTLLLIWDAVGDSEVFGRFYGILLILAVLAGVVAPLLAALRRRTSPGGQIPTTPVPADTSSPSAPSTALGPTAAPATIDPETAAALQEEAARRGITVAQLVAPLLQRQQ